MLKVHGLKFKYKDRDILKKIEIQINKGEILSILGPNGTGKTTLLKCIAGIIKPQKGSFSIGSKNMSHIKRNSLAKQISYVPQSSPSKFPITVFEAVLMGRSPYIMWRPSEKDLKIVVNVLKFLKLEEFASKNFDQLSGGEKQKVLIARAVAQDTEYLLMDEPTSNLDLKHQMEIMEVISNMVKTKNVGAVFAMHDLNLASRFSDRIIMLSRGEVFCTGRPEEVITIENIKRVYGVNATIKNNNGILYVFPDKPVNNKNSNLINKPPNNQAHSEVFYDSKIKR
ncbi:ABC transporter ATP-binding protein [Desulfobacula sp.]|uniref:ABC transporter ATP-binding protein n=1 Tax=Desulfobacula sp. TaxID=2593537 RepID=UPI0026118151|nr:ABC transporter ATP-binding protein [Desulfobacula sp.]